MYIYKNICIDIYIYREREKERKTERERGGGGAQPAASAHRRQRVQSRARAAADYLTQCIDQMVFESQFPHKTVNLLLQLVIVNNELTDLWGS